MQCSPAQRAFPQMCDDLHASCQVKSLTNPTCFCFWLWLWFHTQQTSNSPWLTFFSRYIHIARMPPKHLQMNATQTSPKECHPNIPKRNATQTPPQNESHPNISPKRMPPKHLVIGCLAFTIQLFCHYDDKSRERFHSQKNSTLQWFFLISKKDLCPWVVGGTWKEVLSKVCVCSMFLVFKKEGLRPPIQVNHGILLRQTHTQTFPKKPFWLESQQHNMHGFICTYHLRKPTLKVLYDN
jgi:hypothetical protein